MTEEETKRLQELREKEELTAEEGSELDALMEKESESSPSDPIVEEKGAEESAADEKSDEGE